jgi:hypothetical protein
MTVAWFESSAQPHSLKRIVLAAVLSAATGGACNSRSVVDELGVAIVPTGDVVPSAPAAVRTDHSVEYAWNFETHFSWSDYSRWVEERVRSTYRVQRGDESTIFLGRYTNGDSYRITMHRVAGQGATEVHVQVVASPD